MVVYIHRSVMVNAGILIERSGSAARKGLKASFAQSRTSIADLRQISVDDDLRELLAALG
jgi:hypothetical protein